MSIEVAEVTDFLEALCAKLDDPACRYERRRARSRFSPALAYGRHTGPPIPSAKSAAVLIVLEPREPGTPGLPAAPHRCPGEERGQPRPPTCHHRSARALLHKGFG